MTAKTNPFDGLILDEEEQALEGAAARGEFQALPDLESTKKMLREAAQQYRQLNTTKPVTLRVKQLDLIKIKAKAKRRNIPYQTLLSTVLHDFAEDDYKISL